LHEKPRILVVDDESVIRELLTDLLREEGYEVASYPSGKAALEHIHEKGGADILFTDIMMPEMDGLTLVRKAKRVAPTIIPIIMTGYATLNTARAAVREGAYDYITKPFSLVDIKNSVAHAVDRGRLMSDNAELRDLSDLFPISETINTTHNRRELLDYVTKSAVERLGASRASIMLVTPDGRELQMGSSIGVPDRYRNARVRVEGSMSGWVVKSGSPLCIDDLSARPDLSRYSLGLKDPSFISVPLERKHAHQEGANGNGNAVHDVLNVNNKLNGGRFSERDLKILNIVANQSSIALENVRLLEDVQHAHLSSLEAVARLVEAKDPYIHGHSQRVANYAVMAARELGFSADDVATLRLGAQVHDVGKIAVSDTLLNKSGELTPDEWEEIKRHPVTGYEILKPTRILNERHLALVRSHHERMDGSGYPDGLAGDEIDPLVRVLAGADTFDAMSCPRAYREPLRREAMIEQSSRSADNTLDGQVVNVFIEFIRSGAIVPGSARKVTT